MAGLAAVSSLSGTSRRIASVRCLLGKYFTGHHEREHPADPCLHFAAGHLIAPASAAVIVPTAIASCLFEQLTIGAGQVFQTFEKMGITATLNLLTSLARTLTAGGMLLVLHHATASQWVMASMVVSADGGYCGGVMVTIEFGWPQIEPRLFLKRGAEGAEYALSASTGMRI